MPDDEKKPGESISQHPFVDQVRPDPSAPPSAVVQLEGLAGNSDREGWVRLYFNRSLAYYAEFRREDVAFTEPIPPEQSPIAGIEATRVGLRQDAVIEYTRTTRARPQDEFDLGIQLGAAPEGLPPTQSGTLCLACLPPPPTVGRQRTCQATCTCQTDCRQITCVTCDTCNPHVFTCGNNPQCRF
jgi:hypothetical protein